MKKVPLSNGMFATVDDEDYDLVASRRWHAAKKGQSTYAVCNHNMGGGRWKMVYMHHMILTAKAGLQVHHRDGDGLNNTRQNICLVTRAQNMRSLRKKAPGKSSKYRGVSFAKERNRWVAQIHVNNRPKFLGRFITEEEAAAAYDRAAKGLFGEWAHLNLTK